MSLTIYLVTKVNKLLEIKELEKSYKSNKAVSGLSLNLFENEILCILGPNGAGKSTTINIIMGLYRADAGEILFEGKAIKNWDQYRCNLGLVPQEIELYENATALENVRFFASLYGIRGAKLKKNVNRALEMTMLSEHANKKAKTYSGGMKRRLNIACAIAHDPKIIIMDEPTVGIDPQSRNHILQSIKELRRQGKSIIYSTHYMEEVEEISTRIIVMDKGKEIAVGTKEQLIATMDDNKTLTLDVEFVNDEMLKILGYVEGVKEVFSEDNKIRIVSEKKVENLNEIITVLQINKNEIYNVSIVTTSLETYFLNLTGRKLRD